MSFSAKTKSPRRSAVSKHTFRITFEFVYNIHTYTLYTLLQYHQMEMTLL